MARLRPARCYREFERPYTRKSRYREKNYIRGGVPHPRIRTFEMGNKNGEFDTVLYLISKQNVQIRDVSLEAARLAANRTLEKKIGKMNYYLWVRKYPHHVLRWNPLATGAGADRFQKGMRKAYGKPIGIAARVKKGSIVMELRIRRENLEIGKYALKLASIKMPGRFEIVVEKLH